jgi:hypothetical protein
LALLWLTAAVSMSSPAGAAGVPIEGKLLASGVSDAPASVSYFMDGTSDEVVQSLTYLDMGDISPDMTKVAYSVRSISGLWHANTGEIWAASVDGSSATDLSGPTGLGGVNCHVRWSPDGSTLAFMHATPAPGQMTCDAGWQVWLMNSDGTGLRQWLPSNYRVISPTWSPDGYWIMAVDQSSGYVTADVTGAHITSLPLVGMDAEWSKDGSKLAYGAMVPDVVAGESGVWRQFLVADPDGNNPIVVEQRFLKNSDITAHIAKYNFQPADHDWVSDILGMVGPHVFRWSPLGDQVAFIATIPFDPNGPEYWYQREVWLYDFSTQQLTRLTHDSTNELCLSYSGPNTTSTHSTVTVDNASVTFPQVTQDGWTSIIRTEDLPPLPTSYLRLDNFYQITSTAQATGPATVAMSYADADVAAAAESHIAMLRYNAATAQWEDITTSRDAAQNIVSGQSASLGLMGLAYPLPTSDFSDVTSSTSDPYWALWEIEAAYAAGIVKGYLNGTYQPTAPVTRDQMAVYIARAMNGGEPTGPATLAFGDIQDADDPGWWAIQHIAYCADHGVVKGFPEPGGTVTYRPGVVINRYYMAAYIARAIAGGDSFFDTYVPQTPSPFTDVLDGDSFYKYIEYCYAHGVVKGFPEPDGTATYRPAMDVSRDYMAVYVARAFQLPM